jgi:NAD+ synthase
MKFSRDSLKLDAAQETERIVAALRHGVQKVFRRQGAVVGISGGVDSAVVCHLCVRAFTPSRVIAVIMPDRDSNPDSERLARSLAGQLGLNPVFEPVTDALVGLGCYRRRDEAIRRLFPDYDPARGYKAKIVLPQNLLENPTLNVFSLTVVSPDGRERSQRLGPREFLQIVAASNFKQRSRMAMLYYHAELNNYAVIGTSNKDEYDQGFLVKYGDGGVDIKPIAHLYKMQVYQLAEYLGVPEEIRRRPPTTDTYSAACTQEEFFFRLPFETLDLLSFAQEHSVPPSTVAEVLGLSVEQVSRAFEEFERRRRTTAYLRAPPLGVETLAPQGGE